MNYDQFLLISLFIAVTLANIGIIIANYRILRRIKKFRSLVSSLNDPYAHLFQESPSPSPSPEGNEEETE